MCDVCRYHTLLLLFDLLTYLCNLYKQYTFLLYAYGYNSKIYNIMLIYTIFFFEISCYI